MRCQLAGFFLFGTGQQTGKLLAERIYFDNETIMRQLRGEMDEASVVDFSTASGKGCAIRRMIHAAGRVILERCLPQGAASVYYGRFFRDQTPRVQRRRILLRPA